ncbi:MAG: cysteine synthase A [Rikenellaceae bacterium]
MGRIARSLLDVVGQTPIVELNNYVRINALAAHLIAKVESFNPAGSIKDRVAKAMVEDLEQRGLLLPGATIIEPTSGNTGIGLAMVAAAKGYRLILTMPETMSIERRRLLAALGAELHLTAAERGMSGAIERATELCEQIQGSVIPNQFENPVNPSVHYTTTAEEIWRDTDGAVDILVAGVGTGGTISGIGARLKELNPNIKVVAVEPASSPVLSGGVAGAHSIQGIGAGFIPKNYNAAVVDRVVCIEDAAAIITAHQLALVEGLLVGISSGAALCAAHRLAQEPSNCAKRIVIIMPDSGERYLSK